MVYKEHSIEGSSNFSGTQTGTYSSSISYGEYNGKFLGKSDFQSQSRLARQCSPPKKPYPSIFFHIFALIGGFWLLVQLDKILPNTTLGNIIESLMDDSPRIVTTIFIVVSIGIVYIIRYFLWSRYLWKKYNKALSKWKRSWLCLKCGKSFLD